MTSKPQISRHFKSNKVPCPTAQRKTQRLGGQFVHPHKQAQVLCFEVQKYPHILIRRPTQQFPPPPCPQLSWSGANCHLRPKSNYGWALCLLFLFVGTIQWPPKWAAARILSAHYNPQFVHHPSRESRRDCQGQHPIPSHPIPSQLMYIVQYIPFSHRLLVFPHFVTRPSPLPFPFNAPSSFLFGHYYFYVFRARQSGGGPSPGHWGRENPKLRLPVVFLGQTGSQQCC